MNATARELGDHLNRILREEGQPALDADLAVRFGLYGELLLRWNARMNLTSVRDEDGILRRHFVECIRVARALPADIDTLLDFGSGAGFPGLPIALCRPQIAVTLAESQGKKAAFLQEAVRTLSLTTGVHAGRAEALAREFGCVTMRAVERMHAAMRTAAGLVRSGGYMAILTTRGAVSEAEIPEFTAMEPVAIGGEDRVLLVARRV